MRNDERAYLLFSDHLGSSLLVRADGTIAEKAYYLPWGGERGDTSITSTDYGYTGQMKEGDIYYYGARYYDPAIGRFMQADTIVPLQVQGTQAFDRYAYVNNNPLRYTDPSGHHICSVLGEYCETKDLKNEYRNKTLSDHPHRPSIEKMMKRLDEMLYMAVFNSSEYKTLYHDFGKDTCTIYVNGGLNSVWEPKVEKELYGYQYNGEAVLNPYIRSDDFWKYAEKQPDLEVTGPKRRNDVDVTFFRYGDIYALSQFNSLVYNHVVVVTRVDLSNNMVYVREVVESPSYEERQFWETNTEILSIRRIRYEDPNTFYWGGR